MQEGEPGSEGGTAGREGGCAVRMGGEMGKRNGTEGKVGLVLELMHEGSGVQTEYHGCLS